MIKAENQQGNNQNSKLVPNQTSTATHQVAKMVGTSYKPLPPSILSHIEAVDFSAIQGNPSDNIPNTDEVSNYLSLSSRSISLNTSKDKHSLGKLKLILDSGAFPHMSARVQNILLADGTSKAKIHEISSILIPLNNFILRYTMFFLFPHSQPVFSPSRNMSNMTNAPQG